MKRLNLDNLSDAELVSRFAAAAKEMGEAVLDSETRLANRMYDVMRPIDMILRARGAESRLKLGSLLNDKNPFVRYYAAKKLLGLMPLRAREIIEWNAANRFDAIAGDARSTLRHVDTGFYRPD